MLVAAAFAADAVEPEETVDELEVKLPCCSLGHRLSSFYCRCDLQFDAAQC